MRPKNNKQAIKYQITQQYNMYFEWTILLSIGINFSQNEICHRHRWRHRSSHICYADRYEDREIIM